VGRSRERAFAYLLYPSEEAMTSEASTRLATLADHTELGSGFKIAMRDLDIRGAGNLLGDEQSGHVAAVGFELYCQLIDEAVAEMSQREDAAERAADKEPVRLDVGAHCRCHVPFEAAKIDMHRRIAGARHQESSARSATKLTTVGAMPVEVRNLLDLQRARVSLGAAGATSVQFRGGKLSVSGIELDSEAVEALGKQVEGVLYEWRAQEISVRVTGDADARLAAVRALADGLSVVRMDMLPDS
jgi:transcription-repair coupling factor (superfamily II helicase)